MVKNITEDFEIDEGFGVVPPHYDFEQVFNVFLSLITDFDLAEMEEEDLVQEIGIKTKIATSKLRVFKGLNFNPNTKNFSRALTDFEATIIGHAVAIEWLTPQINSIELFRPQMSSKDFTQFSNANRLSEMRQLRNDMQSEVYKMIDEYDFECVNWDDLAWVILICTKRN